MKPRVYGYTILLYIVGWIWLAYFVKDFDKYLLLAIHGSMFLILIAYAIEWGRFIVWDRSFSNLIESEKKLIAENEKLKNHIVNKTNKKTMQK